MTKVDRKGIRRMRIKLKTIAKRTRRGKRVALMCGIKGVTILCYVFTPGDRRRDERQAIRDLAKLLYRIDPDVIYTRDFNQYPSDLFFAQAANEDQKHLVKFSYAPHKLWHIISEHPDASKGGRMLGPVLDEFGGSERSFRAALAVLLRERLVVVTRNGFVWVRDVAKEKIGVSLEVTPKEIYQ